MTGRLSKGLQTLAELAYLDVGKAIVTILGIDPFIGDRVGLVRRPFGPELGQQVRWVGAMTAGKHFE